MDPQPLFYDINISLISDEQDVFLGELFLYIKNVQQITMNADMEIFQVYEDNKNLEFELKDKKLSFSLENSGKKIRKIKINFKGKIRRELSGLYRTGDSLVTQFEPTDARKFIPCFDEPKFKSIFRLKISVKKDLIVLFNTPVIKKELENDTLTYFFEPTPLMSTYLLALAVGKYEAIEYIGNKNIKKISYQELLNEEGNCHEFEKFDQKIEDLDLIEFSIKNETENPKIRLYTERGDAFDGLFSLSLTPQLLLALENLFGYKYPLKKIDLLSVSDFASGAMENFGLITFRETSLLVNKDSNPLVKIGIADTLCHELVHQWFGNLVTPQGWNELWLNEGFATFMSYYCLNSQKFFYLELKENQTEFEERELKIDFMEEFASDKEEGLSMDSLCISHPIIFCDDPNQVFDSISYEKSSAIIYMLFDTIKFDGLRKYIKEFVYRNATSTDLFDRLNSNQFMDFWTKNKNYPLLIVNEENGILNIKQEHYTLLNEREEKIWEVPIKIKWKNEIKHYYMKDRSIEIKKESEDFVFNYQSVGFYRTFFRNLELYKNITISTVNDLYSLLRSGHVSLNEYLSVIENNNYDSYYVYESILSQLYSLRVKINLKKSVLMKFLDKKIDFKDDFMKKRMEALRVRYLVLIGEEVEVPEDLMFRTSKFIQKNMKSNCAKEMFEIYLNSSIPDERTAALSSIFYVNDIKTIQEYLQLLGNKISVSNTIYVFSALSNNRTLYSEIIDLIINLDYDSIFKGNTTFLGRCLESFFFAIPVHLHEKIKLFLEKFTGIEQDVGIIRECMEIDKRFLERASKELECVI